MYYKKMFAYNNRKYRSQRNSVFITAAQIYMLLYQAIKEFHCILQLANSVIVTEHQPV